MNDTAEAGAPDGVAIHASGHKVRLKWHRLKRRIGDVPFTPAILAEAFSLGASCEIDLKLAADGEFVVLHDETLDRETTGSGEVAATASAAIGDLRLRAPDGTPTEEKVLLLRDIASLAAAGAAPGTLVQLDLKQAAASITGPVISRFREHVAPVAGRFILSSLDFEAVRRLAEGLEGIAVGFDPCDETVLERLVERAQFDAFAADALAAAPSASTIYLDYRLILKAATLGCNLVQRFHEGGRQIDAYTLNSAHPHALGALRTLVALEVDQITTDEPIKLQAMYERGSA